MIVVFRRTGQRRYSVVAKRSSFPELEMNPAPGYHPLMPHDLMHLVVEAQLGLTRGVFGQLAAGGDAGTFHRNVEPRETPRHAARVRNRVKARGKKLQREGREESEQSERATYICLYEWLARSQSSERATLARSMTRQAIQVREVASTPELRALNRKKLDEICTQLDKLSFRWSNLKVGQSMSVRWPDLDVSSDASS